MITYNDLYEALRKERYSEQLQQLPKTFISEIAAYFSEKKELASRNEDLFSDAIIKSKKQFENAISIFKELILRRKKKLLNLAFVAAETGISKRDFENMLDFEKRLFDQIMQNIDGAEKELSSLLNGKSNEQKNKLVIFKEDTEEFLGLEGDKFGPFKKGDMANLPVEIANILESGGKIDFIEE